MQRSHKIAIARIFSDLIKSDRVINTDEMECWAKVCEKYSISRDIAADALNISFSDALEAIRSFDDMGLRESILEDCRLLSYSDGNCSQSEALITTALLLALDKKQPFSVESISVPKANFNVDVATVLYIENTYDKPTNDAILKNYRFMVNEFHVGGFNFVYLPKIVEHYQNTDPKLFHQILSFLAPMWNPSIIDQAYRSLMDMTTAVFCKDLLCNKCGIEELRNTYPSLLIKLGNSYVGNDEYANYLKIEVDRDILATVQSIVDSICDIQNNDIQVVNAPKERGGHFYFHGFYKQLLDIFLIRKDIRSRIVINPYKEEILFADIDIKLSKIHRREKALYALLLCCGLEGLNFNQPISNNEMVKYQKRLAMIQARYQTIYSMFGGEDNRAPDLSDPTIRRPILSCLRRAVKNIPSLYNPMDYNVTKSPEGVFAINVDPNIVFVKEIGIEEPVPMKDSNLYRRFMQA